MHGIYLYYMSQCIWVYMFEYHMYKYNSKVIRHVCLGLPVRIHLKKCIMHIMHYGRDDLPRFSISSLPGRHLWRRYVHHRSSGART